MCSLGRWRNGSDHLVCRGYPPPRLVPDDARQFQDTGVIRRLAAWTGRLRLCRNLTVSRRRLLVFCQRLHFCLSVAAGGTSARVQLTRD